MSNHYSYRPLFLHSKFHLHRLFPNVWQVITKATKRFNFNCVEYFIKYIFLNMHDIEIVPREVIFPIRQIPKNKIIFGPIVQFPVTSWFGNNIGYNLYLWQTLNLIPCVFCWECYRCSTSLNISLYKCILFFLNEWSPCVVKPWKD